MVKVFDVVIFIPFPLVERLMHRHMTMQWSQDRSV